jgi:hypothetical protein
MKSFDYFAVTYNASVYCVDCLPDDAPGIESDEIGPIFADSEWDRYPTCDVCGTEHDYVGLTEDGLIYHASGGSAYFDRFDICEAHYLYASHYHTGQFSPIYAKLGQLDRLGFRPGLMLSVHNLSDNALTIYANLITRE